MKKLVSFILLAVCLMSTLLLAGCGPKCQHIYTHLESTTATCTAAGVETYVCDDCGETTETKNVEAYGHRYSEKTDTNMKCKTCDLLMFNMNVVSIPETITVYNKRLGDVTRIAELKVNGYSWKYQNNYLFFSLDVTIEYISEIPIDYYPKFAYSITSDLMSGDFVVKDKPGSTGDTVTITEGMYLGSYNLDYSKQYNIDISIYEVFTFERDPLNPMNVQNFISGTMKNAE